MSYPYHLLDVFTDRPFAGNPLAVFPASESLRSQQMQAIANELNLSETVFIGAPLAPNHFPIRIFTPTLELPFAGHPTVGTAHLLAAMGMAERGRPLTLSAAVGNLEVSFDGDLAWFTTAGSPERRQSSLDRAKAAELLGLSPSQVVTEPVIASRGLPFHLIELDSLNALQQAIPSAAAWARHVSSSGVEQLYLYVAMNDEGGIRSRMFSMESDIREDPATGSAAAALTGMLADMLEGQAPNVRRWRIEQGVEMGRASRILSETDARADSQQRVRIGGQAVLTGNGAISV